MGVDERLRDMEFALKRILAVLETILDLLDRKL